ncbi:MAG: tetratricopeptide repeat protein [Bryobacter sp.]|nr:tetratricopeptide repeat protein [Bryobacter sp.]
MSLSAMFVVLSLLAQSDLAQSDMELGMKALDANKPAEAEVYFAKAAAADAKDYAAFFHLALAQSLQGKNDEAIANYDKVLALKPKLYEASLNVGILHLGRKNAKAAIPHLEAAVETKPEVYRPRFYLAEALFEERRPAEAESHYRKALAINPNSAEAAHGLGQALLGLGKTEEGAPFYEQAAQLDRAFEPMLLHLAEVYEADKNYAKAIALYRRFPNDPAVRERLGHLLTETGEAALAIPELEAAVKNSPTVANLTALATAYLQAKQAEKCQPLLDEALRLEPNNGDLRLLYGRLLRELRKMDQASQQFFLATKLNPNSAEAWSDLATTTVLIERYDIALTALDRVRALNAEKPGHKYLRAITLDKVRQNRKAAKEVILAYEEFLASSQGKFPDEEFKARQRIKILNRELNR